MKAIIPVAGYATRLFPLTENKPKALLTISGKTILNHFFDKLNNLDVFDEIILVSNDKFFKDFKDWALNQNYNFSIKVINDGTTTNENRIGAVGDFILGINEIKEDSDIFISAGDGVFEDDFSEMLSLFKEKKSSVIATKKSSRDVCQRCGVAVVDEVSKIISFVEKPKDPPSDLVGIMTYLIKKDDVKYLKESYLEWKEESEMNAGEAIRYLIEKKKVDVFSYSVKGQWFDIGTKEHLMEADDYFS